MLSVVSIRDRDQESLVADVGSDSSVEGVDKERQKNDPHL